MFELQKLQVLGVHVINIVSSIIYYFRIFDMNHIAMIYIAIWTSHLGPGLTKAKGISEIAKLLGNVGRLSKL